MNKKNYPHQDEENTQKAKEIEENLSEIVMNANVYCFDASNSFDLNKMLESAAKVLDVAYTNCPVASFRMFPWDKEMSDHVGMEIII